MFLRALICLACLLPTLAAAQDYPTRTIRMIVPFAPGGGTDVLARIVAQKLNEQWGQPVIIENKPGASGGIGTQMVAKSEADGYTLLMASTGALMAAAGTLGSGSGDFDVNKHFAPVTVVAAPPYLVVADPNVPAKSIAELIKLGRDKPGVLTYGSSGVGAASHLAGVLFQREAKIEMLHVPYKGTGPAVTDLIAGRLTLMFAPPQVVQSFVEASALKALAVTSAKRSKFYPGLPTVSEAGLPGYEAVGWFGLLAPVNTPAAIVDKLNKAVVELMATKEFHDRLAQLGAEPEPQSPSEFGRFINADVVKWTKLVNEAGITTPGGR